MPTPMKNPRPLLLALLLAHLAGAACAADWQLVLSDRDRRIEIDRASILRSDAGTKISWGRVVLTSEEAQRSGYAMIKALNRYDCRNRTFATVKRVYVDAEDNIVREEPVSAEAPIAVARNTVDERMWREVCDPPSAVELQKLAAEAARVASEQPAAPGVAPPQASAAATPAAVPPAVPVQVPAAAAQPPVPKPAESARAQSGSVRQPGEESVSAEVVRTAGGGGEPAAATPALETHVEIPAKFLPGGQGAAEPESPRKSILPPLPRLSATAAPEPKAPPATKPAVRESPRAQAGGPPAPQAPAPTRSAAAPERRVVPEAEKTPASVRAEVSPARARPRPQRAESAPPERPVVREKPLVARAEPATPARPTSPGARALAPKRAAVAEPSDSPAATPASARAEALRAAGIELTRLAVGMPEWSYEGETGPDNWGRMRPEWRICEEGLRQSPIDLRDGIAVDLAPVQFDYRRTGFRIRDTGNTLQVEVGEGMGITVRGVRYALERFTLHRPSQDRVGGMAHDMALYLQHRAEDGRMAILSLLLSAGGEANPALQTLWNNLPLDRGREFTPDAVLDLPALLPAEPGHYLYTGSLPMPPCTEDVLWVVMKQPVAISADQLDVFARLYPRNGRPIQPTNGRPLLESR